MTEASKLCSGCVNEQLMKINTQKIKHYVQVCKTRKKTTSELSDIKVKLFQISPT